MHFQKQFDVLWSIESISHYQNIPEFFASASRLLKPGGSFAITAFSKKRISTREATRNLSIPSKRACSWNYKTMDDYEQYFMSNGLQIMHRERLNKNCAKTWDLCLDIIKNRKFWGLAITYGPDFVSYLKGFEAMRAGYASGNLRLRPLRGIGHSK